MKSFLISLIMTSFGGGAQSCLSNSDTIAKATVIENQMTVDKCQDMINKVIHTIHDKGFLENLDVIELPCAQYVRDSVYISRIENYSTFEFIIKELFNTVREIFKQECKLTLNSLTYIASIETFNSIHYRILKRQMDTLRRVAYQMTVPVKKNTPESAVSIAITHDNMQIDHADASLQDQTHSITSANAEFNMYLDEKCYKLHIYVLAILNDVNRRLKKAVENADMFEGNRDFRYHYYIMNKKV